MEEIKTNQHITVLRDWASSQSDNFKRLLQPLVSLEGQLSEVELNDFNKAKEILDLIVVVKRYKLSEEQLLNLSDIKLIERDFYESSLRIAQSDLPKGWYKYGVRENDEEFYGSIEKNVWVNHFVDIFTQTPIHQIENGHVDCIELKNGDKIEEEK